MLIKYAKNKSSYKTTDGSDIYEILNSKNDQIKVPYSMAIAEVKPFSRTKNHYLKYAEVYYILQGTGLMTVEKKSATISEGDAVFIPPLASQFIENKENKILRFMAIVSPPWKKEIDFVINR